MTAPKNPEVINEELDLEQVRKKTNDLFDQADWEAHQQKITYIIEDELIKQRKNLKKASNKVAKVYLNEIRKWEERKAVIRQAQPGDYYDRFGNLDPRKNNKFRQRQADSRAEWAEFRAKHPPSLFEKVGTVVCMPFCFFGLWLSCMGLANFLSGGDNQIASVWACERVIKQRLKDPGSYQFISDLHTEDETIITYRAKNSFGGYAESTASCSK